MEQDSLGISPTPKKVSTETFSFYDALKAALLGSKISRLEWGLNEDYGVMRDGFLKIFTSGELQNWIVSEGDIEATDWFILGE